MTLHPVFQYQREDLVGLRRFAADLSRPLHPSAISFRAPISLDDIHLDASQPHPIESSSPDIVPITLSHAAPAFRPCTISPLPPTSEDPIKSSPALELQHKPLTPPDSPPEPIPLAIKEFTTTTRPRFSQAEIDAAISRAEEFNNSAPEQAWIPQENFYQETYDQGGEEPESNWQPGNASIAFAPPGNSYYPQQEEWVPYDQPNPPWYPAEPAHGVAPAQGKARMDQSSIDEAIRRAEMAEAQAHQEQKQDYSHTYQSSHQQPPESLPYRERVWPRSDPNSQPMVIPTALARNDPQSFRPPSSPFVRDALPHTPTPPHTSAMPFFPSPQPTSFVPKPAIQSFSPASNVQSSLSPSIQPSFIPTPTVQPFNPTSNNQLPFSPTLTVQAPFHQSSTPQFSQSSAQPFYPPAQPIQSASVVKSNPMDPAFIVKPTPRIPVTISKPADYSPPVSVNASPAPSLNASPAPVNAPPSQSFVNRPSASSVPYSSPPAPLALNGSSSYLVASEPSASPPSVMPVEHDSPLEAPPVQEDETAADGGWGEPEESQTVEDAADGGWGEPEVDTEAAIDNDAAGGGWDIEPEVSSAVVVPEGDHSSATIEGSGWDLDEVYQPKAKAKLDWGDSDHDEPAPTPPSVDPYPSYSDPAPSSSRSQSYPPAPRGSSSRSETKMFIGLLPHSATKEDIAEAFSDYETVTYIVVKTDRLTGESKGFGYISFGAREEAERAMVEANSGMTVGGRTIRLDWTDENAGFKGSSAGGGSSFGGGGGGSFGGVGAASSANAIPLGRGPGSRKFGRLQEPEQSGYASPSSSSAFDPSPPSVASSHQYAAVPSHSASQPSAWSSSSSQHDYSQQNTSSGNNDNDADGGWGTPSDSANGNGHSEEVEDGGDETEGDDGGWRMPATPKPKVKADTSAEDGGWGTEIKAPVETNAPAWNAPKEEVSSDGSDDDADGGWGVEEPEAKDTSSGSRPNGRVEQTNGAWGTQREPAPAAATYGEWDHPQQQTYEPPIVYIPKPLPRAPLAPRQPAFGNNNRARPLPSYAPSSTPSDAPPAMSSHTPPAFISTAAAKALPAQVRTPPHLVVNSPRAVLRQTPPTVRPTPTPPPVRSTVVTPTVTPPYHQQEFSAAQTQQPQPSSWATKPPLPPNVPLIRGSATRSMKPLRVGPVSGGTPAGQMGGFGMALNPWGPPAAARGAWGDQEEEEEEEDPRVARWGDEEDEEDMEMHELDVEDDSGGWS